jgi:hypothetical protein
MKTEVKKQHYVPRFLLRNFTESSKKKQLFVFNKRTEKKFRTSPEQIAHENKFYDFKLKQDKFSLEPLFADIENITAPIIRKIIQNKTLLKITNEEKEYLSLFILYQQGRTRHAFEEFKNNIIRPFLKKILTLNSPLPEGINVDDIDIKIDDDFCKINVLMQTLKIAIILHKEISRRDWILFKKAEGTSFIIGDHPVIMDNNTTLNLGLLSPGVEIYMPLSSEFLLGIWNRKNIYDPKTTVDCNYENMRYFNSRQVIYAESYLFSSENNWNDIQKFLKSYPIWKENSYSGTFN